ncbi:hypothetical protein ACIO1C_00385 [Streptomyces sp. NPDC087420]
MPLSHKVLLSGRSIELSELRLSSTYGGMLEGVAPELDPVPHRSALTVV